MIIKAPNPITGLHVSLHFRDGVARTDDPWLIQWFSEHGYQLEEEAKPEPPEEDQNAGRAKVRNRKDHIAV